MLSDVSIRGYWQAAKRMQPSLVVIAVDLFVKGLGVERAGGAGGTGDDQQSNKGGHGRLHGYLLSSGSKVGPNQLVCTTRCRAEETVLS